MRVSSKLKSYIDELNRLAWARVERTTSDAEFVQTVKAINESCRLADTIGTDRTELRNHMTTLYPEFTRRIYAKRDIQDGYQLIETLSAYIYGRSHDEKDLGPLIWRQSLLETTLKAVVAYRKEPKLHPLQYVTLLLQYSRLSKDPNLQHEVADEVMSLVNRQIDTSDQTLPDEELMRRILMRTTFGGTVEPDRNRDLRWTEVMEHLIQRVNVKNLTDEQLLLWIETSKAMERWHIDFAPSMDQVVPEALNELTSRKTMSESISLLAYRVWSEWHRLSTAERKAEISKMDKAYKDTFLQDVISIAIDDTLTTKSLQALSSIYLSRYMSVCFIIGERESEIKAYCKRREKEIFDLLAVRLTNVADDIDTLNETIDTLEIIAAVEREFGGLGTTKDTENLVDRTLESLLRRRSLLPEHALLRLLALKYADSDYAGMKDEADWQLLQSGTELMKATFGESADIEQLKTFSRATKTLGQRDSESLIASVFMRLSQQALSSRDRNDLEQLSLEFCLQRNIGIHGSYRTVANIAEMLGSLTTDDSTLEEWLTSLSATKFVESCCEMDILNAQNPAGGIILNCNFDANEVAGWLNHLVAKARRGEEDQTTIIRDTMHALLKSIFSEKAELTDEDGTRYRKLTYPIDARALQDIVDADRYLLQADDDYVNSDECVWACDAAYSLSKTAGFQS